MAKLSYREKVRVLNYFEDNQIQNATAKSLANLLNELDHTDVYNGVNVSSVLNNMSFNVDFVYNGKCNVYSYDSGDTLDGGVNCLSKEKNILHIVGDNDSYKFDYDFATGEIVSEKGILRHNLSVTSRYLTDFIDTLKNHNDDDNVVNEWIFNYLDDFRKCHINCLIDFITNKEFSKFDKDLVDYIKDNTDNYRYNKTVREFKKFKIHKKVKEENKLSDEDIVKISRVIGNDWATIINAFGFNNIRKMMVAGAKAFEIRFDFSNLYQYCKTLNNFTIDNNRSVEYNIKTKEAIVQRERNNLILTKEKKLNFLHNQAINENYIVIVPQEMEDFTKEGQMQNNCVGSYYHDRMARGECLIYFLRNVNSPDKSLVTCRYDTHLQRTVEARRKNNSSTISEDNAIISIVDRMINANL